MASAIAKLDALRAAYPDAEEWMLEGVCASLDALSVGGGGGGATDGATGGEVRDTIASFLGDSDAVDALSAMWVRAPSVMASSSAARAPADARVKAAPAGTMASASAPARAARAPARETKAVRFVERKASNQSIATSSAERRPAPGDALAPGDLAKACVNCLRCGKVYDLRAKDGVISQTALGFLEGSARCTFCGAFVAVTLADGSRFMGGSAEGDASTSAESVEDAPSRDVFDKLRAISLGVQDDGEGDTTARSVRSGKEVVDDDATAVAVAAKDRLVHFDQTSAKRTTVIDDQSEYYEIDGNAWLDEHEREELKKQVQEMRDAEVEAKRRARTTWTLDLIGRRVAAPAPEDVSTSTDRDERADDAALAAAKAIRAALATNEELAQGGGGAAAAAASTARELERSRVVVNPSVDRAPTFLRAAAHVKPELTRTDIPEALMQRVDQLEHTRRVLDDDPFERVALEAAELGFT
jgi:hypothetical protein